MLFKGTGVALATPFNDEAKIDFDALVRLTSYCLVGGVDYIVLMGSTGEASTISRDEQREVTRRVLKKVAGAVPVVLGINGNDTARTTELIRATNFRGISGILSASPSYNRPTQAGIVAHFTAIAAASPVPVILYNIPSRTGVNMDADTILTLANVKNIVGIKEASGNLAQIMKVIGNRPADFAVISGDDLLTLPMIAAGADGVISVAANVMPDMMVRLVEKALTGNMAAARSMHYRMLPLFDALSADGNPAGIKAALHIWGIASNILRLPLMPVTQATYERLLNWHNC